MRAFALAAVAALALGGAACSEREQDEAQANVNNTAADARQAADQAGASLKEEASQVGSAVSAGLSEAAQEVDETTDRMAADAQQQKAETKADTTGNH